MMKHSYTHPELQLVIRNGADVLLSSVTITKPEGVSQSAFQAGEQIFADWLNQ